MQKGDVRYFTIITRNEPVQNVAWTYKTPKLKMITIKDYLAFHTNDRIIIQHV